MKAGARGPGAPVMLVFDQPERVEAAWGGKGGRIARDPSSLAGHVFQPVERYGVANEAAVDEDARQRGLVGRIEAQLNELLAEIRAHLQEAAVPAHGAVLAHDALLAVEEHLVEIGAARHGPYLLRLREQVLARRAARGRVLASVVLRAEPRPVFGVELRERKGRVWQFITYLLTPCPVPSLDHPLGLGVLHAGVEQVNPEVRAD